MTRQRVYRWILAWTSPVLLVLIWLMLLTGLGTFKGQALRDVTLGLLEPGNAGKLHSIWLPVVTALVTYLHAIVGFQRLLYRQRWNRRKRLAEVLVFLVGTLFLAQFLYLYYV